MCGYDWNLPFNRCHFENVEQQVIIFHGAKNTRYEFTVTNYSDNVHSSLGIPSCFYYFYGVTYYNLSMYNASHINNSIYMYSEYFKQYIADYFVTYDFETDNNGNFEFMVTNCYVAGHSAHINLDISVYGYKQKSLNFDYRLPNLH